VPRVLIVGCGDIGCRVARLERLGGAQQVIGVARSGVAATRLAAQGVELLQCDLDVARSLIQLPTHNALIYYFAPPPAQGATDSRIAAFLGAIHDDHQPQRIVLISTSGVYGNCHGAWIDETAPTNPQSERAWRRLDGEITLRSWSQQRAISSVVLRVAGIYGPQRLPIARIRQEVPVLREAEAPFSNRIHADDLARVCFAAAHKEVPAPIYNASDGNPTTMTDYFNRVADLLGLPRPPAITLLQAQQQLSPAMLSYLAESKRLDNRLMVHGLGVQPDYPDLASGLPAR